MPSPPSFPTFRPRAPWWGPDLQTLRNFLRPPKPRGGAAPGERLLLPMADGSGDRLSALFEQPAEPQSDAPLVVLIHGLSGDETSSYLVASSRHFLSLGFPLLRLNLRGAGPSRSTCREQYHAGRSEDLRDALRALPEALVQNGIALVGYSLGGNMLLKFLAEFESGFPIRHAASVSAPIDLASASRRFLDRRNRIYHMHMLRRMKQETSGEDVQTSAEEARIIRDAKSILEFDERIVAPRNGFANADAYYAACHARQFLGAIRTPTLVIHAQDDPWIPAETYLSFGWGENRALTPLLPKGGGHVGFHGEGSMTPWYDRCLGNWFASS